MGTIASQITSLTIVYSTVYSDANQRKHQSSASLAFERGIHRGPVSSSHKWPVTRKMFPFDDVIMGPIRTYRQTSYISAPNPQTWMLLVLSYSCLCPIHWSHVLGRELRCSWSSTDRRCSNYMWVINIFIVTNVLLILEMWAYIMLLVVYVLSSRFVV